MNGFWSKIVSLAKGHEIKEVSAEGLVCISYAIDGVTIAVAKYSEDGDLYIDKIELLPRQISGTVDTNAHPLEVQREDIKEFVEENDVENFPCAVVISQEEYTVKMLDTPQVPDEEIKEALKYELADFVNYPVDEQVVDYFKIPAKRKSDDKEVLFALSMQQGSSEKVAATLLESGLHLVTIDIPELSFCHAFNQAVEDQKSGLLLWVTRRNCKIIVLHNNELLVLRSIDVMLSNDLSESDFDALSLEIQRSLDYASSVFAVNIPYKLFVFPVGFDISRPLSKLANELELEIISVDFANKFPYFKEHDISSEQDVFSVGQFCRKELELQDAAVN